MIYKVTNSGLEYLDKLIEFTWHPKTRGDDSESNVIRREILISLEASSAKEKEGETIEYLYWYTGYEHNKVDKEIDYLIRKGYVSKT